MNRLNWNAYDLINEFTTFKQYTELLFDGPLDYIKIEKQLTYVLIWVGHEGLKIYNTWTIDQSKKMLEGYWNRLKETIEPKSNFRIARYNLTKIHQIEGEKIYTYITCLRSHITKCQFRATDVDERIIECLIANVS